MIKRPTVFVVGAGGSVPYGFPSGPQMLREARGKSIEQLQSDTIGFYPPAFTKVFFEALRDTESNSIDALLEHRTELDHIGRLYIARQILTAEHETRDHRPSKGDWLGYLFDQMATGKSVAEFSANPITFVTYNYDRRIEDRLSRGMRARYGATDAQLKEHWAHNPVIHLHGMVGELTEGKKFVPFGARDRNDPQQFASVVGASLERAANMVRVVHQADGKGPAFEQARAAIAKAECVMFLGFSFGRANVDRLGLHHIRSSTTMRCGRYKMTNAETNVFIFNAFGPAIGVNPTVAPNTWDCEDLLREYLEDYAER